MSKTQKATTVQNTNGITDIAHEEVLNPPARERMEYRPPEEMTPEKQIKLEIAKFNLADSAIAQLKDQYGALTISGAEDKEGYKKVREAWGEVRSKRTGLEKKGLELRSGYGVITKAIGKEEDRLIELIKPLEENLYGKWKAIDEEKEREKKEKEAEEQRLLMVRVEEVLKLGMTLNDGFYSIGDTISMDVATLRGLPEDAYNRFKTAVKAKFDEIQKAEAEAKAERQRQADELKRQQEEVRKQQEEMKKQQEEIRQQMEQLRRDQENAANEKLKTRKEKFVNIGMAERWDDVYFNNGESQGISIPFESIQSFNDKDFSILLQTTTARIEYFKVQKVKRDAEEKAELEARAKAAAIEDAKREEERKAEEARLAKLAMGDKERFDEIIIKLAVLRDESKTNNFKSTTYIKRAGYLYKALIELVNTNK